MMKHILRFAREEEGQATIEYFLIVGAAILAAVTVASSYYKMGYSSGMSFLETVNDTYQTVCTYVAKNLEATNYSAFCPSPP